MKYVLNLGGDARGVWRLVCPRFSRSIRSHVSMSGYVGAYRAES